MVRFPRGDGFLCELGDGINWEVVSWLEWGDKRRSRTGLGRFLGSSNPFSLYVKVG